MFLVVDVNVIFSALISHGNSSRFFVTNVKEIKYTLITPEFFLVEIGKHTSEIAERSHLPFKEIQDDITFLINQIEFISEEEYKDKLQEAREILKGHEKDVPYLALALKKNCNIFSGDKTFRQLCPDKVKTPKELLEEFYK